MNRTISRLALAATLAFPAALVAQTPTPEGTTITNTATASFTDANGNTYSNVTAQATVRVGFLVSIDVLSAASVAPASPSTGNSMSFTIANAGNGTDSVTVGTSAAAGVSIASYRIGATGYATLADLNLALSGTAIAAGSNIAVEVLYSVAAGQGGQTIPVTLTATSRRITTGTGSSDNSITNVQPAVAAAVVVSDNPLRDRVPSNGTQYTETFTVTNNGNASDTFTLTGSLGAGAVLNIVSVNGSAGTSGSVTIGSGASANVAVVYTVNGVAAGSQQDLQLTAASGNNTTITDQGVAPIRVIRASLVMAKAAFRDDQTAAINSTSDRVLPGEYIQYRITVTNTGGAPASAVSITDPLTGDITYVSAAGDGAGWTITTPGGVVTANLTGTLAAGASRFIWVRVRIN